jgi:hypothetical protein
LKTNPDRDAIDISIHDEKEYPKPLNDLTMLYRNQAYAPTADIPAAVIN